MALAPLEPFHIDPDLPSADFQYHYTIEELREYVKCKDDPVYFIKNYMKIIDMDKGLVPFSLYPFQEQMINNFHDNRFNITMCSRQVGKALCIDTPILTSIGWKKMQDVHPGDYVYTPKGTLTEVIAESPIFTNHDVFVVHFDTKDHITADANHLWSVEIQRKRQIGSGRKTRKLVTVYEPITLTTQELRSELDKHHRIRIRATQPLQFSVSSPLPLDPYLFGLWLGDGFSSSSRLIGSKDDVNFYESQCSVTFTDNHIDKPHLRLVKFSTDTLLKSMGVFNNKHIPDIYLQASVEDRLSVLQGLMDSDGNANGRGGCQFYQKMSSPLLASVRELLWGLGIKHRFSMRMINGREYGGLQFSTTLPVFRLPRKLALHTDRLKQGNQDKVRVNHEKSGYWYIRKINPAESTPVKCISVSDPEHVFLCGKQLVPTHNSTTVIGYFLHYVLFNVNVHVCISANKQKTAVDLLGRMKLAFEKLPRFLQQGVVGWAQMEIKLSNGSRAFAAATSSSAVRGGSYNILLLDEFAFVPENIANEFYASTFPTITSGKTTKIIMVSTPNGMNLFHKFWVEAQRKDNDFVPLFVHWSEVPGRDEEWKQTTIRNIGGPEIFAQEYECVHGTTMITIRDKYTKEILYLPISDAFELLSKPVECVYD